MSKRIHLVGFGSQGTAWAQLMRAAGWTVSVYLASRESASYERAVQAGFEPLLIEELRSELERDQAAAGLVVMATPDHLIAPLYREYLAAAARPLTLVLLHGYAVYSGALARLAPSHEAALLAPKAIGPKLLAAGQAAQPGTHQLVAGLHASAERQGDVLSVARALGFARENLVTATFEQEAVGDLISEQTLLCGGVFNLIEWTFNAMSEAGVPSRLIREECLTELELIAGLIRERGAGQTLGKISQAAQAGTIAMRERLERAGVPQMIREAAQAVTDRSFVSYFDEGTWREELHALKARLERVESTL